MGPRLKWFLAGLAVALALAGAFIYVVLTNVRYSTTTAVAPAVDISEYVVKVGPHHYRIVKPVSQGEVPKLIKAGYYDYLFIAALRAELKNVTNGWYRALGLLKYCISELPKTEWAALAVMNESGIDVYVADVLSGDGVDQMIEVVKELSSKKPLVVTAMTHCYWEDVFQPAYRAWEEGKIYLATFYSDDNTPGEELQKREREILTKTAEFAKAMFPGLFREYSDMYMMGFDVYPLGMTLPRVILFVNGTVRAVTYYYFPEICNKSVRVGIDVTKPGWVDKLLKVAGVSE